MENFLAENNVIAEYDAFWEELLREAEVTGDPQRAAFFRMYAELAAENGDCADLVYCPVIRGGARPYQVDGYAFDQVSGELHIAICDFRHERELQSLQAKKIASIFGRVRRFCEYSIRHDFLIRLEETSPTFELAWFIQDNVKFIKRIRCVMFSNARLATRKKTLEAGQVINAEMTHNIIDFYRFIDIQNAIGGTEPIEVDLWELFGDCLPFLKANFDDSDYESYLVVMPGSLLAKIYGLYGARLMEQNVRTFLQARTKANKGIINTAKQEPERFFAYNNGITATARGIEIENGKTGLCGISKFIDLQIVNGGQTTASLLYARDRRMADLSKIFVQMKLSVVEAEQIEEIVPLISRYANTQNRVSEADFFSRHPFHVEMQQISRRTSAPPAIGRLSATQWFYERIRGQYRNDCMLLSPADRRSYEAKYPKSQVLLKTDLAKYQLTFACQPHIVSMGAQRCFLRYAKNISDEWKRSKKQFNDEFFRRVVAKAIVFRWLDKHVGRAEWYKANRGYKANIITYTLAWLANLLKERKSSVLDFDLIWKHQSVPDELQDYLSILAPRIANKLKSPPQGISNVSEYAKMQGCWQQIREFELGVKGKFSAFSISLDEHAERLRDAGRDQGIINELELEVLLAKNVRRLPGLRRIARQNHILAPSADRGLKKAERGNSHLSSSERKSVLRLFKRLDELGHGPASWQDRQV